MSKIKKSLMMAVNKQKEITGPNFVYSVRLSVNVMFAQNTAGMMHLEIACKPLFHEILHLG